MLIEEAPYLIDDKAFEKCEGKSLKEQFAIQIDGVRKALGIDQMEDVEMLVNVFYGYEETLRKKEEETDAAELELIREAGEEDEAPIVVDPKAKVEKKPTNAGLESGTPRSEEEVDPNALDLNPDNVVDALNAFEEFRKQKAIDEAMNGTTQKKKNTQESEEQRAEKQKLVARLYWEKLTHILDPQKLSVWRALEKALMKYY